MFGFPWVRAVMQSQANQKVQIVKKDKTYERSTV